MSEAPSWLTEENISTAAKVTQNPAAQKAAKKAAKNPEVQKAVKKEVAKAAGAPAPVAESAPQWASNESSYNPPGDIESGERTKSAASANQSSEFVIEEQTLKDMQRWHLALRLLYMSAAVILAAAAVVAFMANGDLGVLFFCVYTFFFAVMICCFEFALNAVARLIAVNFGFMYSLSGRAIFLLFVGFMSFQISLFGKIAMGVLYGVGCFHAFVMWKFPRFEEYLRKKHYFEGKRSAANL